MSGFQKFFLSISILLCLAFVTASTFCIVCFNEVSTILSYQTFNDNDEFVYYATVEGDYYMDSFVEAKGAWCNDDLTNFLTLSTSKNMFSFSKINVDSAKFDSNTFTFGENNELIVASTQHSKTNNSIIIKTNPKGKYSSVSTVNLESFNTTKELSLFGKNVAMAAPYLPVDGINETGLCATLTYTNKVQNTIKYHNSSDVDITETVLLRLILDNASTIEEAYQLINNYDLFLSSEFHFNISITDKNGNTARIYSSEDIYITDYLLKTSLEYIDTNTSLDSTTAISSLNSYTSDTETFSSNYNVLYNTTSKSASYYLFGNTTADLVIQL